jgi:hypothetical protein
VVSVLMSGAAPAFAAGGAVRLEVTRAPGSAVCPNAGGIAYTAAKLFPDMPLRLSRPDDDSAPRIEIAVEPVEGGHSAVLRSAGGERTIVDWDVQCRGLGEALAVALVVLVAPPAAAPAPTPTGPVEPELWREPSPPDERRWRFGVEAGGLGGVGLLGEPVFGAAVGASVWSKLGVGLRLRGARAFARTEDISPGHVDSDLWALFSAACFRFSPLPRLALVPCAELGWGEQHAAASDMATASGSASRRWLVAGPSFGLAVELFGPLALGASAGMTARLHDQSYLVDDQVVQHQPALGGYAVLGLEASWPVPARARGQ